MTDYNTGLIRKIIDHSLSDEELNILCFDGFHEVYAQFGESISRRNKIQRLLEYCNNHGDFPRLLGILRKEYTCVERIHQKIRQLQEQFAPSDNPQKLAQRQAEIEDLQEQLRLFQEDCTDQIVQSQPQAAPLPAVEPFPEEWIAALPYPLAVYAAACNRASDLTAHFAALDHLMCNTLKYLAAAALAEYRAGAPDQEKLKTWLERLCRRRLSDWCDLLGEVEALYPTPSAAMPDILAAILRPYRSALRPASAILAAYRAICQHLGLPPTGHPTLRHFIERLVQLRQHTWEDRIDQVSTNFKEEMRARLQPALHNLIDQMDVLHERPLCYAGPQTHNDEGWQYELSEWRGPTPPQTPRLEQSEHKPNFKTGWLYLCDAQGQPLRNLSPFLVHINQRLYFLEAYEKDETLVVRPCDGGEPLHIPANEHVSLRTIYHALQDQPDPLALIKKLARSVGELNLPPYKPEPEPDSPPPSDLADLLARLDANCRAALECGLGESRRIGQCWLGVEFLLMGLSRQPGLFQQTLYQAGLHPGLLRGRLRGLVEVREHAWREQENIQELGAAALGNLQAPPADLAAAYASLDPSTHPVITPRLLDILRQAARQAGQAGEEQITEPRLLEALMQHKDCLAVSILLKEINEARFDRSQVGQWLVAQLHIVEAAPPIARPGGRGRTRPGAKRLPGAQPPPGAQLPPGAQPPPGPPQPNEASEAAGRQRVQPLLEDLQTSLRARQLDLVLEDGAWELLCSPHWQDARQNLPPAEAFESLLRQPLEQRIQAGDFQPGDHIQVDRGYANDQATLVFRKLPPKPAGG